jgi:hypothetical protein
MYDGIARELTSSNDYAANQLRTCFAQSEFFWISPKADSRRQRLQFWPAPERRASH